MLARFGKKDFDPIVLFYKKYFSILFRSKYSGEGVVEHTKYCFSEYRWRRSCKRIYVPLSCFSR